MYLWRWDRAGAGTGAGPTCTSGTYPELRPPGLLRAGAPQGTRSTYPCLQGSVIALPSAGFALEHCRISFLVSRLPSRLVSRFDPSASSINVYVPGGRVRTLHAIQHSTHRTDSLILLAGMRPSWVRQPTWALTCPGSPKPTTCTSPCAHPARTILICRDPSQRLLPTESSSGVHDHLQRNNHTCLSHLKLPQQVEPHSSLCSQPTTHGLERPAQHAPHTLSLVSSSLAPRGLCGNVYRSSPHVSGDGA